jgi:hypothetical protein
LTVGSDAAAARLGDALARRARLLDAVLRLLVAIFTPPWKCGRSRMGLNFISNAMAMIG